MYSKSEIEALDNGQGLPVDLYGGGYNCRHRWVLASDEEAEAARRRKREAEASAGASGGASGGGGAAGGSGRGRSDRDLVFESRKAQNSLERVRDLDLRGPPAELAGEDAAIIHDYTVGGRYINRMLWEETDDEFVLAYERLLNDALGKLPSETGRVRRFQQLSRNRIGHFRRLQGERTEWKGFLSSTRRFELGDQYAERNVVFVIESATGKRIEELSFYGPHFDNDNQGEVLFPSRTFFEVIGVEGHDGKTFIFLAEA